MPNKRIWTSTDNLAGHKNKATMFWTAVAEHNKVQRDVISKCKHQQNVLFPRSVLSNCFKQRSFLSLDLCSKDRRRCCRVTVVKFWLELREDKGDQNIPALYIYIYTCICHQPLTSCPLAPIPLHLLEDTTRKPSALLQVNVEFWETRVFVPRFCNTRVECSATLQFCQQCNVFCSQWTYLFLF